MHSLTLIRGASPSYPRIPPQWYASPSSQPSALPSLSAQVQAAVRPMPAQVLNTLAAGKKRRRKQVMSAETLARRAAEQAGRDRAVLLLVKGWPGVHVGELYERLQVSRSTVLHWVDALIKRGALEVRGQASARQFYITPKGIKLMNSLAKQVQA